MENYKRKYLKYKNKYLILKQKGGAINIEILKLVIANFNTKLKSMAYYCRNLFNIEVKCFLPGEKIPFNLKSSGFSKPVREIPDNNFFIYLTNSENDYLTFLYATLNQEENSIYFSYTFTDKNFRSKGYSTFLRLIIMDYARQNKINFIKSVPFDGASSLFVLEKLSFIKKNEASTNWYEFDISEYNDEKWQEYMFKNLKCYFKICS